MIRKIMAAKPVFVACLLLKISFIGTDKVHTERKFERMKLYQKR